MILAGSCTIEKRLYLPGLNIEWKKFKHHSMTPSKDQEELSFVEEDKSPLSIATQDVSNNDVATLVDAPTDQPFYATIDNQSTREERDEIAQQTTKSTELAIPVPTKTLVQKILKNTSHKQQELSSSSSDGGSSALKVIG